MYIHTYLSIYIYTRTKTTKPNPADLLDRVSVEEPADLGRRYLSNGIMLVCVCIYIYIYEEREREIDIHIYIYMLLPCVSYLSLLFVYGITRLIRLIGFAACFATFEESMC